MAMTTKTNKLEEPVINMTNQSRLHVHEKLSDKQADEKTSSVWVWLLVVLAILFVLGLAGFGGVYFFQRYRNVRPLSYQGRYNVMYKLQSENL